MFARLPEERFSCSALSFQGISLGESACATGILLTYQAMLCDPIRLQNRKQDHMATSTRSRAKAVRQTTTPAAEPTRRHSQVNLSELAYERLEDLRPLLKAAD